VSVRRTRLAAPGPVEVPPAVLEAIARPPLHHRTEAFATLLATARAALAELMGVPGDDVAILSGSGTTAFEAAFLSVVPAGAPVAAVHAGKFGRRWASLARRHGHEVVEIEAPWGDTPAPERIAEALAGGPEPAAVTLVHSETSTGTLHDVEAQAAAVREVAPQARIVVDAVTSLAVSRLDPRGWGLDAVVAGSQKGVMLPPGLGFAWLSERVRAAPPDPLRTFSLDLHAELPAQAAGRPGTTPAVGLIAGLAAVAPLLLADGLPALWAERARRAAALLAAGEAAGCRRFSHRPSPAVAALRVPAGVSAPAVVDAMARRGVRIAGGQDATRPFLIRPSALGWLDDVDVLGIAATLEAALREAGAEAPHGASVVAAARALEPGGEGSDQATVASAT
jgi:aspartate aminotransferase-like enzyme